LEQGESEEREQDLRDRQPEVECGLPEHLQRRDHGREVQPRVAELRQENGVGAPADREREAAWDRCGGSGHRGHHRIETVKLQRARGIVDAVVTAAPGPVSVFVADAHGELVAAATMDGAAPDTRLNAQRKAYTAARSDARS